MCTYLAKVQPALIHLGFEVIQASEVFQNQCLRKVMGAYKRTPTAALERESNVLPVDLHMEHKGNEGGSQDGGPPSHRKDQAGCGHSLDITARASG